MARQCGADGDLSCFGISNFADHDYIRILSEYRSKCSCECDTDIRSYMCLVDAGKVVLDRIFNRGDIDFRFVDIIQSAVKRSRLTAAGGACHQDHPKWQ